MDDTNDNNLFGRRSHHHHHHRRRRHLVQLFLVLVLLVTTLNANTVQPSQQSAILLKGLTVLEPPFIYSESGPYRGYCIDVLDHIAKKLSFNYTLQQSPDGQIGSVQLMNGIFGELSRNTFEFAIGDISRNWGVDEKKAAEIGVLFTKPIFSSTMSVLLSKHLLYELEQRKEIQCLEEVRLNAAKNQTNNHKLITITYCSKSLRLDDIYESNLTRIAINQSPVHEFYSTVDRKYLPLINWVDKASLFGYGLEKLKTNSYVLIDETKFTHYLADQDDNFELVNVAYAYNDGTENVRFDDLATSYVGDYKARQFRNEISIAFSKSMVELYRYKTGGRDLLREANEAIEHMRKRGRLRELQNQHWRRKFLHSSANTNFATTNSMLLLVAVLLVGCHLEVCHNKTL